MAKTTWRDAPISPKQIGLVTRLADEKVVSGLNDELLDRLADVASEVAISSGEASELINALLAAPRKAKPVGGFTPLVSTRAERLAEAKAAQAEYERLDALHKAALVAAGGKSGVLGACVNCSHADHTGKTCPRSEFYSLGYDDGYNIPCECKDFVAVNELQEAARAAGFKVSAAQDEARRTEDAANDVRRGDRVVVARGRKVPKGSKGQIIKVDPDGRYGASVFLLLDGGDKVWTSLSNIDHEE